ncbi:MAG: hypothetical protein HYW78_01975 [Parcubacteria group bacterium]|nr:hypothetical protein [Parcubacteria group bacterium]
MRTVLIAILGLLILLTVLVSANVISMDDIRAALIYTQELVMKFFIR